MNGSRISSAYSRQRMRHRGLQPEAEGHDAGGNVVHGRPLTCTEKEPARPDDFGGSTWRARPSVRTVSLFRERQSGLNRQLRHRNRFEEYLAVGFPERQVIGGHVEDLQ